MNFIPALQNLNTSTTLNTTNRVNTVRNTFNSSTTVDQPDVFVHDGITVKGNVHDVKANFNGGFQCFACDLEELSFWSHFRRAQRQAHKMNYNEILKE